MDSTLIHICLESAEAPDPHAEPEEGTRWVCTCGDNFVYRGGFNRGGGYGNEWFPAPALPQVPQPRSARGPRLFRQRKG